MASVGPGTRTGEEFAVLGNKTSSEPIRESFRWDLWKNPEREELELRGGWSRMEDEAGGGGNYSWICQGLS